MISFDQDSKNGSKNLDGFVFNIDNRGAKTTVPGTSKASINCWAKKKSGAC